MESYGVIWSTRKAIVKIIRLCVQSSGCVIKFNSQLSKLFSTSTGLQQGDALSPMLFNILLEKVVRKVLNTSERIKRQYLKADILVA